MNVNEELKFLWNIFRGVGLGGQGGCERRSEVIVKIKKKNRGRGVWGWVGGGQGECERRSKLLCKFKKKKSGVGWGQGDGGQNKELKFL